LNPITLWFFNLQTLFTHYMGEEPTLLINNQEDEMTQELAYGLQVGQTVPDFALETYDPERSDFGKTSLNALEKAGKWTILFFYPADFTFV